jgi:uncharacterized protein YkwD
MNSRLITSAHAHDVEMALTDDMSHQLRGEANFTNRIARAGYRWIAAGENIGWTTLETSAGLQALERSMYNEKPPNDGHRQNILSKTYRDIGIDVYFDRVHHRMWFTQDFGRAA